MIVYSCRSTYVGENRPPEAIAMSGGNQYNSDIWKSKVRFKSQASFIVLLFAFILSGCAVIDSSNLDTAQNLAPGRLKILHYQGYSLNTHRLLSDTILDYDGYNELEISGASNGYYNQGIKFGVGLTNRDEINISFLTPAVAKIAWKHRLSNDSLRVQRALMPSVMVGGGEDRNIGFLDGINGSYRTYWRSYSSNTVELPFMVTIKQNHYSMTACLKVGYNRIKYTDYWREDPSEYEPSIIEKGVFDNYMAGLIFTPRVKLFSVVLMPEVGIYGYETIDGSLNFVPVWNFGIGFESGEL